MKRIFTAAIAVAAIALAGVTHARAATFPALTTIYFASGAMDSNESAIVGIATAISCSNMSGQTASVRYQFRSSDGTPIAGATLLLANLATKTITTEGGVAFLAGTSLPTASFFGGALQILSTQSAIYCSAWLVDAEAEGPAPSGYALHMVRFNPHPERWNSSLEP